MQIEVLQGHQALPQAAALEVAALIRLHASPTTSGPVPHALHVGFCLDHSGSMSDASGVSGMTKLDALKAGVQGALQLLEGWDATVTVSAFSDAETMFCRRQRLSATQARKTQKLCADVEALTDAGGTEAKTAMEPVLKALLPQDHAARRLILVTDGHFNSGSVKPCRTLAQRAGEAGVAIWAFATGVTYDEAYLRELVDLGAPGGLFCHVSNLGALRSKLEEELGALANASDSDVDITLSAGAGCRLVEVVRLTPVQTPVAVNTNGHARDHLDVLDARGQGYVVRVGAGNLPLGRQLVLSGNVSWQEHGRRRTQPVQVHLDVLPAGAAIPAAHAHVVSTVLSVKAAQATLLGNAALATQLYAAAGQTQLAQQLSALGTALPSDSDAARSLRTQVLGSTRLVALGSAQVPNKGGQP
ncbi:MAG: VWA domain-containing protein [Myxococcota bacterium]